MTELEPAELDKMQALLEGDYQLDSRMMLHVEVERHGRRVYENDALNDIVIAKGTAFRVVRVGISADGEEVTRFNGDGVIAATPTGSTAYGLSAGGPVIEPSAENLAVIPICAHALAAKSFVFAPERTRRPSRAACEGGSEVFISADGGQGFAVRPDDRVHHHALCAAHAADPSQGQQLLPNTAAEAVKGFKKKAFLNSGAE